MRAALLLSLCALLAACETAPVTPPAPRTVRITVNAKPYTVQDGTAVTYRDPRTGRMIPLSVVNP